MISFDSGSVAVNRVRSAARNCGISSAASSPSMPAPMNTHHSPSLPQRWQMGNSPTIIGPRAASAIAGQPVPYVPLWNWRCPGAPAAIPIALQPSTAEL